MLVFNERGKPEYLKENLSVQSREPRDLIILWCQVKNETGVVLVEDKCF